MQYFLWIYEFTLFFLLSNCTNKKAHCKMKTYSIFLSITWGYWFQHVLHEYLIAITRFCVLCFSKCGGGAAGVLADETGARRRPAQRRACHLRVSAGVKSTVRVLRHPARGLLLRQLPGESLFLTAYINVSLACASLRGSFTCPANNDCIAPHFLLIMHNSNNQTRTARNATKWIAPLCGKFPCYSMSYCVNFYYRDHCKVCNLLFILYSFFSTWFFKRKLEIEKQTKIIQVSLFKAWAPLWTLLKFWTGCIDFRGRFVPDFL